MPRFGYGPRRIGSKTWYARRVRMHFHRERTYSGGSSSPSSSSFTTFICCMILCLGFFLSLIPVIGGALLLCSVFLILVIVHLDAPPNHPESPANNGKEIDDVSIDSMEAGPASKNSGASSEDIWNKWLEEAESDKKRSTKSFESNTSSDAYGSAGQSASDAIWNKWLEESKSDRK